MDRFLAGRIDIIICPFILVEVLCGFRFDHDFERACDVPTALPFVGVSTATQIKSADLYRRLRHKGVTVRSLLDCVIAQVCIETGAELLTIDRDFSHIARHSRLKLVSG